MSRDLSRVLVTGAGGMIGRALPFGVKLTHADLDVRDRRQVERAVAVHAPSAVLHLAALDIRQAEADPRAALETNVLGTRTLADVARAQDIPLIFLSSGAVFGGRVGMVHDESAQPAPVNLFGATKWLAERLIQETCDDVLIVRTGWVFGGHQAHHRKFVEHAIERALRNEPITATMDQWGSPTFVRDLGDTLGKLIADGAQGIVHVVNLGAASGVDIAAEIVRTLQSRSPVMPVRRADLPNAGPPRPASEVLTSRRVRLRPWDVALREYVTASVRVPAAL